MVMARPVENANIKLSYPLYAAEFDPENDRYLLVGGGGGEGRSGVENKITLLDAGIPGRLSELADLDLSRDEDAVTTLAYVRRVNRHTAIAIAGVNSSTAEQQAGNNEHLRALTIVYPHDEDSLQASADEKKLAEGDIENQGHITQVSRRSLFSPSTAAKKETYQRLLRLSPVRRRGLQDRLAVVATGLAPQGELVAFNPSASSLIDPVRGRLRMNQGEEAADVDIIKPSEGRYLVAYCTDYDVCICEVSGDDGPVVGSAELTSECIYTTPHGDTFSGGGLRPTFRAIRFLTPSLLLILSNKPGRTGVELLVLRRDTGSGEIILRRGLHRSMKAGIGLDVSRLGADEAGPEQFVIAAAGQDISIELLTLDHHPSTGLGKFHHHATYRDVHPLQMTKVCLSNFLPREDGAPAESLRMASVSMGNTVVVHTLPVSAVPVGSGQPRYALALPSPRSRAKISLASILLAVFIAILARALFRSPGHTRPVPDSIQVPPSLVGDLAAEPLAPDHAVPAPPLGELLRAKAQAGDGDARHLVIVGQSGELGAQLHADEDDARAAGRKWEDLEHHEREQWKRKLAEAGEYMWEEGETVLKGVFFGQLAEAIGHAVGG